jgi:hypothetical protein
VIVVMMVDDSLAHSLMRQTGKRMLSKDGQHLLPSTLGTWEEKLGFEVPPLVALCTQKTIFISIFI